MKICNKCSKERDENDFHFKIKSIGKRANICKICVKEYQSLNKDKIKNYYKNYYRGYYERNKSEIDDYNKIYYINNKKRLLEYNRIYDKNRRSTDPAFRLRKDCSRMIRAALINKYKSSILKYLPYTMDQLRNHIENLFESWMSWENWGKYNFETWTDSDQTTWTWQLDHVVPQSILSYSSMEDENFKICWALENLRPLSAKQNYLDGVSRIRHKL